MYFVYVLYSVNFDRQYVGMTMDCLRRLHEHNEGRVKSTKAYLPWVIIHTERFSSRVDARVREKYLKSAVGRRWRKENLKWPRSSTEYPPVPNYR